MVVVAVLVVHVAVLMVVIVCLVQYNMHMAVPEGVFHLTVLFMVLRPMDMAWL